MSTLPTMSLIKNCSTCPLYTALIEASHFWNWLISCSIKSMLLYQTVFQMLHISTLLSVVLI